MSEKPRSTLVILNPTAGSVNGDDPGPVVERIEEWASAQDGVELRRTTGEGDAENWTREAARAGTDRVVAAGGDGTIADVARGLLRIPEDGSPGRPSLGILPLGTGNDMSAGLGIPDELDEALEVLTENRIRRMDVLELQVGGEAPRFVINALTGGFSGLVHGKLDAETKKTWGRLAYLRSGVEAWGERVLHSIRIEVDGTDRGRHDVLNLILANGPRAGGGIPVAPGADPFDGTIDVVLLLDATPFELSTLAARILTSDPEEHPYFGDHPAFVRYRGTRVRVKCDEPLPVSLDGEPEELLVFEVILRPGELRVVAPARRRS